MTHSAQFPGQITFKLFGSFDDSARRTVTKNFLSLDLAGVLRHGKRKCADTIGTIAVPWAGHIRS